MSIRYTKGYRYRLVEDYVCVVDVKPPRRIDHDVFTLEKSGVFRIKAGYSWDGASGPAIDTKDFMRGSLVHDALYQLIGMGLLSKTQRKAADETLRRLCREDGMSWVRAHYVYRAVRMFGGAHVLPGSGQKVRTAP